ncbi:serologically defined colon cancer antigen 8 homolog isoform X1 [Lepisosteus oculatus]|uniref:serologically defined colon cancer antigen 8 homolog isoform X1 n=2 Tax=Lepisosteus oculatus TaxID=7918 RepID=UPI0035F52074
MKPTVESEDDGELEQYQQALRDRASRSARQLRSMLGPRSPAGRGAEQAGSRDSWHQLQHSAAVNQLRSLLRKQEKESLPSSPSREKSSPKRPSESDGADLPAVQDLVPIIHNQSEYIQHLEAEVRFCKEELLSLKQRIRVVVVENEKLLGELKSRTVEDTLKDYTILDATTTVPEGLATRENVHSSLDSGPLSRGQQKPHQDPSHPAEEQKWQSELDKLKQLYQAQRETLEAHVVSLRKELATSQKEGEEVKSRLRHQEALAAADGASRVGGLCLKCAQHEAVLAQTHTHLHAQVIERLTKERDDLLAVLSSLRASQGETQQREWGAYQQVKQAVEMAEEANLEKTRALVQCEQLQRELSRQRQHLERELAAEQEKIGKARDAAREEAKREKEELAATAMTLSQKVASLESQLERLKREKSSLSSQLEEAQQQLNSQETDISKVCGELRYQLDQTRLQRGEAERELQEYRIRTARELELAAQEAEKWRLELSACRQRLEGAQQDASRAKAEALSLAERLGRSQHQLHLTRQEKEAAVRCRSDELKALTFRARRRERELTQKIQHMEAQRERGASELDDLLSSQNTLIRKLKDECCNLGTQLEEVTSGSRSAVEQLSLENEHLRESLDKQQARCAEMEEQCVQHGRMHQRMKNRLQQLDQHCQLSAQQVCELLHKQSQLMRERQALAEELQQLRVQVPGVSVPGS